ncbi:UTP--glucose-1-phosphate uridylyltransferase [Planctomyces sp. SH-PL62]|uniref:UTP--glucose-1-phosphate uridylyltransferase n=1 Tax=Planctomyces sp. SH-PL62 TaxID=1636152 RepID=UPI00078DDFB2|nr:UTP--glucose-1-phosphate uridylyltransferase [Planctomyces sp. SH-PL62]AMV36991.1 UTP--glucose-1-phosphate uridylyltransferase [Planctomyces sp. SH-PL62]
MASLGSILIETITGSDPAIRDRSARSLVAGASLAEKLQACEELERFRRRSENLYERVRASLFLHAIYRYDVQEDASVRRTGLIPFDGYMDLMERRYEQAVTAFRAVLKEHRPNGAICSALAQAYDQIAFQTLADQVRRSVRSCPGNRWMFRVGGVDEHPLRLDARLLERDSADGLHPILMERTPVRLDLSHSGWSDIFFLGMDFPEGARVLNISVDLGVHGRDDAPTPPIECRLRVISEPILRLTSIDLDATKDVDTLEELFNFGNDYLGLVKAGVIASGLVPPSLEGTTATLADLLARVVRPGHGLEIVSKVNDIPKGSRLAVSTNLLASLIALLMRATGQTTNLVGPLDLEESRVVVARAILGEWLGGSGGGWQDSGGVFPGVKLIMGVPAGEGDPEWGVSRGRLLPEHRLVDVELKSRAADGAGPGLSFAESLASSMVLVHGGMAQNVGPILNMVTAKYLLRDEAEWRARREALRIFEGVVEAVDKADVRALGGWTTANWEGPLKGIIPWITSAFTEGIIREAREALGDDFWGFLMLGGMSGGGMAFMVDPARHEEFKARIGDIMRRVKRSLDDALPFAMEPVVYDFRINPRGTWATLQQDDSALMPARYYTLQIPRMIAEGTAGLDPLRKADVDAFANRQDETPELLRVFRTMINKLFPVARSAIDSTSTKWDQEAEAVRLANGFDAVQHEALREDLIRGRIGLARNRLPVDMQIHDVDDSDLIDAHDHAPKEAVALGERLIRNGEVAVVSLAAGVGSRWTSGAGVVKAINPFAIFEGRHRSFLEVHLAKTKAVQDALGATIPHVVTTSYLTHEAIARRLAITGNYGHDGPVHLSRGQSIGQRLVPMARDLTFLWEESTHETLDENKQKVREAGRRAILDWARSQGEGADYVDNVPLQRFNPPGHFYEVPNLLRNGLLAKLLVDHPNLKWLMVHNIDTLGASVDPGVLGLVVEAGSTLSFEVLPRRIDDRGGGLARVGGRLRLLEGLAQPREDSEFALRYYNSMTTWVRIDGLLQALHLSRDDLGRSPEKVAAAVRSLAARVPTYVTIKDVKKRWGHGQEDVLPVAQFEKLWGDLTSLPDLPCSFLSVDRRRGQQLKDAAQLDGWVTDGSRDYVASLCKFPG